jgi:hypothetical protein
MALAPNWTVRSGARLSSSVPSWFDLFILTRDNASFLILEKALPPSMSESVGVAIFAVLYQMLLKIIVGFARTKKEAKVQMQYFG